MITLKDFYKITTDLRLVGYFPKKTLIDRTLYTFINTDVKYYYLHLSSHMNYEIETKDSTYTPWIGSFISTSPITKLSKITRRTNLVDGVVEITEVKEEIPIKQGTALTMVSNHLADITYLNTNANYPNYKYAIPIDKFENLKKVEIKNTDNGCYITVSPAQSYCILESFYSDGLLYTHVRSYTHRVLSQANSIVTNELHNNISRDRNIITGSFRTLVSNLEHVIHTEGNKELIKIELAKLLSKPLVRGLYE